MANAAETGMFTVLEQIDGTANVAPRLSKVSILQVPGSTRIAALRPTIYAPGVPRTYLQRLVPMIEVAWHGIARSGIPIELDGWIP